MHDWLVGCKRGGPPQCCKRFLVVEVIRQPDTALAQQFGAFVIYPCKRGAREDATEEQYEKPD